MCQYMYVNECVCSFEADTKACPVTRTEEVRPTEVRPKHCLLSSLNPFKKTTHKPEWTSKKGEQTDKKYKEGQNEGEERLRIKNETERMGERRGDSG